MIQRRKNMNEITKIVLTGGPCAGKTTALQRIEKEFTEKGYKVFIIGESATELITAGARPFGTLSIPTYQFQKGILGYQLYKEAMYENFANTLPENTKCLLVCDRGALDNKAYIDKDSFAKILEELDLKEIDLLTRYKMILHLVTAAKGAEEFYTLANNEARSETKEEARRLDDTTLNCWMGHPNLHVIGNDQSFAEKMDEVRDTIHRELGIPVPIQQQRKFLIDLNSISQLPLPITKKMRIEQTYLDGKEENCFRKMSDENASMYFEIHKKDTDDPKTRIKTMRRMTEKEYLRQTMSIDRQPLMKDRYSFVYHDQYFRLDIFRQLPLCLLEVEPTEKRTEISLPPELTVLDEVTENPEYRNFSLFQQINNQKKYKKDKEQ